jgi:Zn-dependent protease
MVDYYRLRRPLRDMALVAIAGPLSNFLLAIFFFFSLRMVVEVAGVWNTDMLGPRILLRAVEFNLILAAFNLLPIAPLDGSRVMTWLLPAGLRDAYRATERFGFLFLLLLVWFFPPVQHLLAATVETLSRWVVAIVSLGGLW